VVIIDEAFNNLLQAYYQQFHNAGLPHWQAEYVAEVVALQAIGQTIDETDRRIMAQVHGELHLAMATPI
jgi:hypothetical protein